MSFFNFVWLNGFLWQILSQDLENELGTIPLNIDSGLGVFDAFIASFSMIIVSEVCASTFPNLLWMRCFFLNSTLIFMWYVCFLVGGGGGGLIFKTNLFAMYRLMNLWRFVILDWRWDFHNSSTYGNASSQVNRFVGCALCSVCYDCKLALSDLMVEVLYIILSFTQIIFVFDNAVLLPGMPFSFILDVFKVKIVVHVN